MSSTNRDNLRDHISDIEDGYDTYADNIAEVDELKNHSETISELKKVAPAIISGWNLSKSGIDGCCKFLSDAAPIHKCCSAPNFFFLWEIRYSGYNAMIMYRILKTHPQLSSIKTLKEGSAETKDDV